MPETSSELFEVECPCCGAAIKVDPRTQAIISHKAKEKPHVVEDLTTAVERLRGESARREEMFKKQMAEQKTHQQVLSRKFDELLKQARETPNEAPPIKDIDLD